MTGFIAIWGFAIVFAAALKIYPIFGLVPFMNLKINFTLRDLLLGAILATPIALGSFFEIRYLLDGTTKGFEYAFGLPSLGYHSLLQGMPFFTNLLIGFYLLFILVLAFVFVVNKRVRNLVLQDFQELTPKESIILLISSSIFFLLS